MRLPFLASALAISVFAASAEAQVSATAPQINKLPTKVAPARSGGSHSSFLVGGSDNCANAAANDAISGPGSFSCNATGATSGAPIASCGAMGLDVWFYWTATGTGTTVVSACGGFTNDTVFAVWADGSPAGSCPTTQIACNDDSCGLQSQVTFAAVSGTSYFIEIGSFAGGSNSTGTFTISAPTPPAPQDDCSLPSVISGLGTFPVNTTGATDSPQQTGFCTTIHADVWFQWTSSVTATVRLTLCTGVSADTVIAVYPGSACPSAGSQLACNDDFCAGFGPSQVTFAATTGSTYMFQMGNYAAGVTYSGTFTVDLPPQCPPGCTLDDGASENSVGWTAGGTFLWINRLGSPTATTTVSALQGCYGTPLFPGFTPPAGTAVTYAVWSNPANDGNAANTTLVAQVNTTMAAGSIDSDVFQVVPLSSPVTLNGYFFIGCALQHNGGQYVGPLDQSGSNPCAGGGRSWYCGLNGTGAIDLTNLSANQYPPATIDSAGLPGLWLLRADCSGATGVPFCFGDGTGTACPCANNGAAGNGCANSVNPAGANLAATGTASVAADTVVLHGIGMPTSSALYFQGTAQIAVAFGDGLRCAGGNVIRLGIKFNSGTGTSQYPDPGDQSVSQRGLVPAAGGTFDYQCWYRNGAAFCTAATFNLSNGLAITWAP